MRRIVHYYPDAMGHSGVTFALWSWARAQVAAGHSVCVMHAPEPMSTAANFVTRDDAQGVVTQCTPHSGANRLIRPAALERHLGRKDLLVLHEGWVIGNLVAAAAARRAGVPYVVMPHGVYDRTWMRYLKPPMWLRRPLERRLLEGAAAVHVFFESEIRDVAALAPRATFMTVPTGFDLPADTWTGGGGYLAWLGRVAPVHKGLDTLTAAVASLDTHDRPMIRIHGYDDEGGVARLKQLIASHGVGKWIRLEGPLAGADKRQFLQQADGYVHPSRWECHSIALLENLALGVPCLVSSRIHIAPTLQRSRAAVLAEPSTSDLARALRQWVGERAHIAARGRELVTRTFNWNRLMPQFDAALGGLGLQ